MVWFVPAIGGPATYTVEAFVVVTVFMAASVGRLKLLKAVPVDVPVGALLVKVPDSNLLLSPNMLHSTNVRSVSI